MNKDLKKHLMEKKPVILKRWFDAVADTYAEDTAGFLKKKKAQFTNPVGYTLAEGLEGLFNALIEGVIIGRALYEGSVDLRDALAAAEGAAAVKRGAGWGV